MLCVFHRYKKTLLFLLSFAPIAIPSYALGNLEETLCTAIQAGNFIAVQAAVQEGANVHHEDEQPLLLALQEGYWPIAIYLIKHGADSTKLTTRSVNDLIKTTKNALSKIQPRQIPKVVYIQQPWLHPNYCLVVPTFRELNISSSETIYVHPNCLQEMLTTEMQKIHAIRRAAANNDVQAISPLLKNVIESHNGFKSIEMLTRIAARNGHIAMVECLLTHPHCLEDIDYSTLKYIKKAALHEAIIYGHLPLARALIQNQEVNNIDDQDLQMAIQHNQWEILWYFFKNGYMQDCNFDSLTEEQHDKLAYFLFRIHQNLQLTGSFAYPFKKTAAQ